MLDNLILAYRSEIYDWNEAKLILFLKLNSKLLVVFIAWIFLLLMTIIYTITHHSSLPLYLFALIEIVFFCFLDRKAVKNYRDFISNEQNHLNNVVLLLKTAIPEKDLYTKETVNTLIERLKDRIECSKPFSNAKKHFFSFATYIFIPIITFIAGSYASKLSQISPLTTLQYTVTAIVLMEVVYICIRTISSFLEKIIFCDYDASVALREDLLDIRMLYFSIPSL